VKSTQREDVGVPNSYSRQWFEVFLETMPAEWTAAEVQGIGRRIPRPAYRRVLDICCGPGHAGPMDDDGYEVTGVDRDATAVRKARAAIPGATFIELDQRDLGRLDGVFDAALILWQSFGYFDAATNDRVLSDVAGCLRTGGRLLLDVFHPGNVEDHQGRTTNVRDPRCTAITNRLDGSRLTSTIEYADRTEESMEWELFTPDALSARAAQAGFKEIERCTWWDEARPPTPDEQRFQAVFEKL
jgi:SAM-dependent methyltransferase